MEEASSVMTCLACQCTFATGTEQREHYKTEWHRYNLRRKVTGMRPCTLADFEARVKALQVQSQKKGEMENKAWKCVPCGKTYGSENAYVAHTKSKKHVEKVEKVKQKARKLSAEEGEQSSDAMDESSDTIDCPMVVDAVKKEKKDMPTTLEELHDEKIRNAVKLELEECLFCRKMSKSLEDNIDHMTKEHGFFIPDLEFVSDMEGLITYLGEKIGVGNVCLYCNGVGKGFHTVESVMQHMVDKDHCKLADEDFEEEFEDFYDYSNDNSEMQLAVRDGRTAHVAENGYDLVLPSGQAIGNRQLAHFYKQAYKPRSERSDRLVSSMVAQYRLIGYETRKSRKNEKKRQDILQNKKSYMRLGVKANALQHHFREQVLY